MRTIGLLYHSGREDCLEKAQQIEAALARCGVDTWRGAADDEAALIAVVPQLDLLITFGGDGTIVRAIRMVAPAQVPILGVNMGRLGFLAEVNPSDIEQVLPALLKGQYVIEERMMLHADLYRRGKKIASADAINDVVMARGRVSRTVRIAVDVDGHHMFSPICDGIIVATPTGSTAYCLSAGGPIVAPDLYCLTMVPIAAHLGIAHALVVPAHRCLTLELLKGNEAALTVDGQLDMPLEIGDRVCCSASENVARFVRLSRNGYFYETVLRRLGWADRPES